MTFFLLPVYVVTFVLDVPLALIEIVSGYKPIKDPVLGSNVGNFKEHRFSGKTPSSYWTLQKLDDKTGTFLVRHFEGERLQDEIWLAPEKDGQVALMTVQGTRVERLLASEMRGLSLDNGLVMPVLGRP